MRTTNWSVTHLKLLATALAIMLSACSSDEEKGKGATGGAQGVGGASAASGGASSVATTATLAATGGDLGVGGSGSALGGAPAVTGGAPAVTGGSSPIGSGGAVSTGGASTTTTLAVGGSSNGAGGSTAVAGTSNASSGGAGDASGSPSTGGTSAASTSSAPCNTIDPSVAPWVIPTGVAQASPTPSGGTIVNGTYFQTAETHYTGVGGSTVVDSSPFKSVIVINGNTVNQAGTDGAQFAAWTMSFTSSGSSMVLQGTCGRSPNGQSAGYSAEAGSLKIYVNKGSEVMEDTFVRQ